jgi:5-methyltetrahydropteroyltriglutamate--homocysteine methyltransferase
MTMRYRADHVGSLLRPPELIEARTAFNEARLDAGSLQAVENAAILGVLEQQRQAGIGVFTDGEYRRHNFRPLDTVREGNPIIDGALRIAGTPTAGH